MDRSPSAVGARAELEVTCALERAGWIVYLPVVAHHARVDLIALRNDEVLRVQCKTSVVKNGVVFFRTCSNTANKPRSYVGEIDAFGVYCPGINTVFLVPVDGLGERGCQLRLGPPANNQQKGVRFAADYVLTPRC
jgi:hypothetical protein